MLRRLVLAVPVLALLAMCVNSGSESLPQEEVSARQVIDSLTHRLAQSVSRRDAEGATAGAVMDSSVAYISDGTVIRGVDFVSTLESFYSTLDSLQFEWTRKEISFPTPRSAVVIGWASIRAKPKGGEWADAPAIFTSVYRFNDDGRWQHVTTQKTSIHN